MTPPETRYAKSGDVHIAYQVVGEGPLDTIFVPGFVSNVELAWEIPGQARLFSRLILFDKRGTGLSDRHVGVAHLEERMDDVRAVMDAAGSERAALFGVSEGGAMSMLFAATYPERTRALALYGSYARHPTLTPDSLPHHIELIERVWGSGEYIMRYMMPTKTSDENLRRAVARRERQSASPAAAIACIRMSSEVDARDILPTIRVPTLVLHRSGDARITIEAGRYIADHIPGAKFVELPGVDHAPWERTDMVDHIADEIEEFLTGSRTEAEADRVLATVLFTDIVDSTKRAVELGDRQWRALLDRHDAWRTSRGIYAEQAADWGCSGHSRKAQRHRAEYVRWQRCVSELGSKIPQQNYVGAELERFKRKQPRRGGLVAPGFQMTLAPQPSRILNACHRPAVGNRCSTGRTPTDGHHPLMRRECCFG